MSYLDPFALSLNLLLLHALSLLSTMGIHMVVPTGQEEAFSSYEFAWRQCH